MIQGAEEYIELPLGPDGRVVPAAVAIGWMQMMLKAPSGANFIGFALATSETDAIVARMTGAEARKTGLELIERANACERNGTIVMPAKRLIIPPGRG